MLHLIDRVVMESVCVLHLKEVTGDVWALVHSSHHMGSGVSVGSQACYQVS